MVVGREVPLEHAVQHHRQHDRSHGHVETMEAGEHEEGGAVDAGRQFEVQLGVRVDVFVGLEAHERGAQQDGGKQPDRRLRAVAGAQRVVGDGERDARRQQQGGIDGGNRERAHGVERVDGAGRAGAAPLPGKVGPDEFMVDIAQPRRGNHARVKQRAEESAEEHDLGDDEPRHRPAERVIDARTVHAAFGLLDGVAEPEIQHGDDARQAGHVERHAPRRVVHPARCASHGDQQRDAGKQGPARRSGHEIIRSCRDYFATAHCTAAISSPMNRATAISAAITMCTGLSRVSSRSKSLLRRRPKNDHTTALSEYRNDACFVIVLPRCRLHRAAHFKERVRQRNGLDLARQLGVDIKHHRHLARLVRFQGLLAEAEAFDLLEMLHGVLRRVARYRLRRHVAVLGVYHLVRDGGQFARMHGHGIDGGTETVRPLGVGVELDGDAAGLVHLGVLVVRDRAVLLREHVQAQRLADLPIERVERVGKAEHHHGNHQQLAQQRAVQARGLFALMLFELRRGFERVERRRRRHGPLESFGALPRLGFRLLAAANGRDYHAEQEEHLRQAEAERAYGGNHIVVGELRRVIDIAARHAGQAQEVHREEGDVKRDQRQPEVRLAHGFVVHVAGPLGRPVIKTGKQREQRARHQHVVEVRHHVIGVLQLDVDRRHGQDQAGEAADGEDKNETDRKQHRRLERHRALPHGGDPVEHFDARGHGNQHGRVHEEQLRRHRHPGGEHVVGPHDERQDCDRRGGVHHRRIAEQLLARERGQDLRDDAECRQDHDVHLGVAEEPEDVLVHHRVAAGGGVEEGRAEVAVGERHGDRAGQHRHHQDQQVGGDQPGPAEHRHFHQGHARRAHVEDGDDDVDRAHDGRSAHQVHGKDGHVHARAHLRGQRRVQGPAGGGGPARHQERRGQQQRGRRQQPEREVVHARERHVGRADLQRDHPVGKAHEGRHDGAEHHHQAVHGGELVEEFGLEELQARMEQLAADHQRQHAARQQHDEREPQVQRADILVIGGKQPARQAMRVRMGFIVGMAVIDSACAHVCLLLGVAGLFACSHDFGRLDDVLFWLVGPAVAGVGDHGRDFRIGQLFPRRHFSRVLAALLAVEQHVDLRSLVAVDDGGAVQRRESVGHALAVGLVAHHAVGGVDFFAARFQLVDGEGFIRIVGQRGHFLFLAVDPGRVVGVAHHAHDDGHERVLLAAQLGAVAAIGARVLRLEPGVAHETGNRILLDGKRRDRPRVNDVGCGGDHADLFMDRHHHLVVDFHQVVVAALLGGRKAGRAHLRTGRGQVGEEGNARPLAAQVIVAPLPLHAGDLDGDVGVAGVLHAHHGAGGGQRHADHDQERHDGPGDFHRSRFVEGGRFVTQRLAVLEDGIEHDAEHGDKNHQAHGHHPGVQVVDLGGDAGGGGLQVELFFDRTAGAAGGRAVADDGLALRRHLGRRPERMPIDHFESEPQLAVGPAEPFERVQHALPCVLAHEAGAARAQRIAAQCAHVGQQRARRVVCDRDRFHVEHGSGKARFHQLVAEVMHVDKRQRVRRQVGFRKRRAQLAQAVRAEARKHEQAVYPQHAAPFGKHAVRLRMPVQGQVGPHQVDRVRRQRQVRVVAAHQVDAGLGRQQFIEQLVQRRLLDGLAARGAQLRLGRIDANDLGSGVHFLQQRQRCPHVAWIPACAGMTDYRPVAERYAVACSLLAAAHVVRAVRRRQRRHLVPRVHRAVFRRRRAALPPLRQSAGGGLGQRVRPLHRPPARVRPHAGGRRLRAAGRPAGAATEIRPPAGPGCADGAAAGSGCAAGPGAGGSPVADASVHAAGAVVRPVVRPGARPVVRSPVCPVACSVVRSAVRPVVRPGTGAVIGAVACCTARAAVPGTTGPAPAGAARLQPGAGNRPAAGARAGHPPARPAGGARARDGRAEQRGARAPPCQYRRRVCAGRSGPGPWPPHRRGGRLAPDRTARFSTGRRQAQTRRSRLSRVRANEGARRLAVVLRRPAARPVTHVRHDHARLVAVCRRQLPAGRCIRVRFRDGRPAAGPARQLRARTAHPPADAARQPQPQPVQHGGSCRVRSLAPERLRRRRLTRTLQRRRGTPVREALQRHGSFVQRSGSARDNLQSKAQRRRQYASTPVRRGAATPPWQFRAALPGAREITFRARRSDADKQGAATKTVRQYGKALQRRYEGYLARSRAACGGGAQNQLRLYHRSLGIGLAVDGGNQFFHCGRAHALALHVHRGQRRRRVLAVRDVVERGHRQSVGQRKPQRLRRLHEAQRHQVVVADQRVGRMIAQHDGRTHAFAFGRRRRAAFVHGQFQVLRGQAGADGVEPVVVAPRARKAQVGKTLVPQRQQVAHQHGRAALVVAADPRQRQPAGPAEIYQRLAQVHQPVHLVFHHARKQDQAVHAPAQRFEQRTFAVGVFLGIDQQQGVIMGDRHAVGALDDAGEMGIVDVEDGQADAARAPRDHRLRQRIGPVAQLGDHFADGRFDGRRKPLRAVDEFRHGGGRDAGGGSHAALGNAGRFGLSGRCCLGRKAADVRAVERFAAAELHRRLRGEDVHAATAGRIFHHHGLAGAPVRADALAPATGMASARRGAPRGQPSLKIGDLLVPRHQQLHDGPGGQVSHRADRKHDHVAGTNVVHGFVVVEHPAAQFGQQDPADAAGHAADTHHGRYRFLREHIGHGSEDIGRPCLREDGNHQHRLHAAVVWRITTGHEIAGEPAAADGADHGHAVEHRQRHDDGVAFHAVLGRQVGGQPEQEEPPHAVGHELAEGKSPGLAILEQLEPRRLAGCGSGRLLGGFRFVDLVAANVGQLVLGQAFLLLRLVVQDDPHAHPEKADAADDDEGPLPAPHGRDQRHRDRSQHGADVGARIEDAGGERTLFLGEVFRGGLDRGREVTGLAHGQHGARDHEADDRRHQHQAEGAGHDRHALAHRHGKRVQDRAQRPDHDRHHVGGLGADAVHHAAGKQHRDRIHELESGGDVGVIGIGPAELPGQIGGQQAEDLAVQVVDGGGKKQQGTDGPAVFTDGLAN
uniref:Uncharacterized protein n=1 Tax=Tanacetum cinerariifolium TaxID=118510 RepID=A0A699GE05_TANCI|nr:hypothetical protein [Tanacetum cinerariifolium]